MKRTLLKQIFKNSELYSSQSVTVAGWVKTVRDSKTFGFIEVNDGSYFKNCQIVFEREKISNFDEIAKLNVGASIMVKGNVLYIVIQEFNSKKADMSPDKITSMDMGYIFEELIRKFSESYNEEAGAHFTSRDIIY
ncbi:MAG: SAM-dependent DNA methyltransferase, partial [Clostridia bacterium]|nr:SAM-dependent DNA methyltransferase [Clostridia bacterium]